MPQKSVIELPSGTQVPNHIAIVPDGNRRWARARGIHTLKGHKAGFERAVELAKAARSMGVHTVTLWGFSTENWDRTKEEVDYLMKLYVKLVDDYLQEAHKEGVKLVHLGRKDRLPKFLVDKITDAERQTAHHTKYIANLAIDYGGQDDILRAVQKMITDGVPAKDVNKKLMEDYLDTHDQPYPYVDLFIRTSGEQRTSGLLMWQAEYAEIYWIDSHFPDFTPEKLKDAIIDYSRRRRRFGGNDTVKHLTFKPEVTAKLELAWWRLGNIPEGTKFTDYAIKHLREQWGLSKSLGKEAATHLVAATLYGKRERWDKAHSAMKKFYEVIRDEAKLAFEPTIAASLEIKLLKRTNAPTAEVEDTTREYLAEVYRISDLQAAKAAHLRALATSERRLAEANGKEMHWENARNYLEKYYEALKERVA